MHGAEKPIGVAVVGTGFGCLTHVRALRAAGLEIRALVGRDPDKTASRAARFEIPHACTTLGDALARADVDAVTVATPPHSHASLVLEAVAAGRHVLCEKPFARDAGEAVEMLAAAEAAGVVHLVGTEFRWATGQALAARVVDRGAIGAPRLATFLLHVPMLAPPESVVPKWWGDASQGGGWLGAQSAHVIDQIRVMLGEITGVSAALTLVSEHDWTAEDTYTVHFRTAMGVEGIMQSTVGAYGPPVFATRVSGTRGTVWIEGDTVRVADRDGTRTIDTPEDLQPAPPAPPPADLLETAYDGLHAFGIDVAPYTRLAQTFAALIRGEPISDDPRPATFADGVAGMRVLDAIRRSAASAAWVDIPTA